MQPLYTRHYSNLESVKSGHKIICGICKPKDKNKAYLEDILDYQEKVTNFCHKNLLRFKILYFFLFNEAMKASFELASKQEKVTPVLFHVAAAPIALESENDETATKFTLVTT